MSEPSVLFISTQLPYPPKSGGTIKSWNYLSDLCNRYQKVGLACLLKDDDSEHLNEFKKVLPLSALITEKLDIPRTPLNLIRSYFSHPCLNAFRNYSSSFEKKIDSISLEYDILIIDHYEVFQYVPKEFRGKVVLHTHNAEFALWQRLSELNQNPILKIILRQEAKRVKAYERSMIDQADLVYATPSDIDIYQAAGFNLNKMKVTYHLGNDDLLQLPKVNFEDTKECLIFMGTLSWEPNLDGICWFIENVFSRLIEQRPQLKLYILGKDPGERLTSLAKQYQQIKLCGFVKELDSYLKFSRVFLAPLRFGSGMKVKVLEGMYRGIPQVSTTVGAEGLEVENEEEIMIADQADDFKSAVERLLDDENLWTKLRDASRKKAAEQYTWEPLFKKMDTDLKKILAN